MIEQKLLQNLRIYKRLSFFFTEFITRVGYLTVFEIRAFQLASYFFGKAHEPLNQNKRFKNQLWVWCHSNLCMLSGLCLFFNLNHTKLPFPDVFDELLFLCVFLFFHQNPSHFIIELISTMLEF